MPEIQVLDELTRREVTQEAPIQRDFHRPGHEAQAINGDKIPQLSAEDAALESFDGLEDLIDHKPASLDRIQKSLNMDLEPFDAMEGHEHKNYINKEKTRLVKIDKIPVDDYHRLGREGVHKALHDIWPNHFPQMYESPSIPDENGGEPTTGIIVEPIQQHPQFAEALAAAQQGDSNLLEVINKHPFTEVLDDCKNADLPFDFDSTVPDNFVIDSDGIQVFIDDGLITAEEMVHAKDKIYSLMEKRGASTDDFARMKAHMTGLEQLIKNKPTIENSAEKIQQKKEKFTEQYGRPLNLRLGRT